MGFWWYLKTASWNWSDIRLWIIFSWSELYITCLYIVELKLKKKLFKWSYWLLLQIFNPHLVAILKNLIPGLSIWTIVVLYFVACDGMFALNVRHWYFLVGKHIVIVGSVLHVGLLKYWKSWKGGQVLHRCLT